MTKFVPLKHLVNMQISHHVPLAPLTTFGVEGVARYFVSIRNEEELRDALSWARERAVRPIVLAGGSNVLIPDFLDGLVMHIEMHAFTIADSSVVAEAGCVLLDLIREAAINGLGGWEKLAGIPGTLGGAVRGNAGAFGPEMKDFVSWVRAMNTLTEDIHEFSNAECRFEYRSSFFKRNPEWLILSAHISLEAVDPTASSHHIEETIAERERRHIQNVRAAGSYFLNPVAPPPLVAMFEKEKGVRSRGGRVPAGWLIEKAGLKGMRIGGAQVSPQQANYLINTGNATAEEVRSLARHVKDEVQRLFGVALIEEAVIL